MPGIRIRRHREAKPEPIPKVFLTSQEKLGYQSWPVRVPQPHAGEDWGRLYNAILELLRAFFSIVWRYTRAITKRILLGPEPDPYRKPDKESDIGLSPWEIHAIDQDLSPKVKKRSKCELSLCSRRIHDHRPR